MTTYLCGGINGLSNSDCRDWREVAKTLLYGATRDPMARDYRGREGNAVSEIVRGDLADIAACDAVLANAMHPSWGTAMEIAYAFTMGKPVVAFVGTTDWTPFASHISPWLRYHTTVCATLEEAVGVINYKLDARSVEAIARARGRDALLALSEVRS